MMYARPKIDGRCVHCICAYSRRMSRVVSQCCLRLRRMRTCHGVLVQAKCNRRWGEVRLFPCTCCLVKVVRQDMLDGPSHPRVRAPSLAEKSDGAAYVM